MNFFVNIIWGLFIPFPFALPLAILVLVVLAALRPPRSRSRKALFTLAALTPLAFGVGIDATIKNQYRAEAQRSLDKVFPGQQPDIRLLKVEQGMTGHTYLAEVHFDQATPPNWKVTEQKQTYDPAEFTSLSPDSDNVALDRFEDDAMSYLSDAGCTEWKQSKVKRFTVQVEAPDYHDRQEGKLRSPARLSGDQNYQNYCLYFGFNTL
ncbi:hypothetical protein DEIGR_100662 [Deinococcus grandis]|uniref:Uncharacterized protein n=1 Tax=Deinococcus grandis TaxID=57498 RepID=A0A100HH56_9DEIO|nr:hypothetical protein [Deinococcus grandis]BBN95882.1 hypothetical protein DEGR_26150 [Deinococcus grandis]GAQ20635.1 hypothetical protein DEIGR_100662 [Deinococcus grandis]